MYQLDESRESRDEAHCPIAYNFPWQLLRRSVVRYSSSICRVSRIRDANAKQEITKWLRTIHLRTTRVTVVDALHNRWARFPIATKVTARALSSAAAHVRTNVKSRADDARDIKRANIIRANVYVAGILISFGVGLFFRRDATRRRYRKCLEGWDRSIPLETRRPVWADDAAVRSYVNYAATWNCIAMIQRRSPSKYFARDVYLVHIIYIRYIRTDTF